MPSAKITTTTPFADYTFRLKATNQQGEGAWSMESAPVQFNYNKASGGTEKEYVAGGKRWKQHVFQSEGTHTLTVETSVKDWKVRLIGRGGNGGYGDCPMHWPTAGGRAGWHEITVSELPVKALQVVVGTSFNQGSPAGYTNTSHSSSLESVGKAGGGGNGCRTFYCYHCSYGDNGTWGGNSKGLNGGTHNGSCGQYSPQGGGGQSIGSAGMHTLWDGTTGNWGYHGHGGGCDAPANQVTPPGPGLVAVTYEIGTATRAQIAADKERRRAYDASDEAARVRQLIAEAEAFPGEVMLESPELDAAIDEAFND